MVYVEERNNIESFFMFIFFFKFWVKQKLTSESSLFPQKVLKYDAFVCSKKLDMKEL